MKLFKYLTIVCLLLLMIGPNYGQTTNSNKNELVKEYVYKEVDSLQLKLRVFYPDGFKKAKKYPTIVFYFGGGWRGGSLTQFEGQSKYLASRGMIAVLVDYRVEKRHQTTPFDAVSDAKSAIRYLRINAKKLHINKNKIVASGGSAGGHLAAATALIDGLEEEGENLKISSKPNALVLFNPVIDNSENGYGFERIGDRYLEISPMHNIKKGAPPTIFMLGSKDKHIPVSTAYDYKARMETVGSRCDVFIYKDQPHGFFNKGKQKGDKFYSETLHETDLFLQSIGYLKGKSTLK